MKQFTRIITRPDNFSSDDWKASLIGIAKDCNRGMCHSQGHGIHTAAFVDTSNWTIIITIIQFEHATQADITEVHQAVTEFIEGLSKL